MSIFTVSTLLQDIITSPTSATLFLSYPLKTMPGKSLGWPVLSKSDHVIHLLKKEKKNKSMLFYFGLRSHIWIRSCLSLQNHAMQCYHFIFCPNPPALYYSSVLSFFPKAKLYTSYVLVLKMFMLRSSQIVLLFSCTPRIKFVLIKKKNLQRVTNL